MTYDNTTHEWGIKNPLLNERTGISRLNKANLENKNLRTVDHQNDYDQKSITPSTLSRAFMRTQKSQRNFREFQTISHVGRDDFENRSDRSKNS